MAENVVYRSMADRPGVNDPHTLRRAKVVELLEQYGEAPFDDQTIDKMTKYFDTRGWALWGIDMLAANIVWAYDLIHFVTQTQGNVP